MTHLSPIQMITYLAYPPSISKGCAIAILLRGAGAACNYGTSEFPREPSVPPNSFSYTGLTGPLNWYGLNKSTNALCSLGTRQSTIDIATSSIPTVPGSSVTLSVPRYPSGAKFENLGTNAEVVVNGTLVDGPKEYSLAQFHFHTPGEHHVNHEYYPMEVHFVFEAADRPMTVVAFLVEFGLTDPLLASVFVSISGIPNPGDATLTGPLDFSILQYHLTHNNRYRYSGSLTTPPYSEQVLWIISTELLHVDATTYKSVKDVINLLENAARELNSK
ncbi:alpha carbonic anhydrase [Xylogone sp. PMI_703]|nr:alpha carbonic anhydrase [Xylogone sp. PMI_703]